MTAAEIKISTSSADRPTHPHRIELSGSSGRPWSSEGSEHLCVHVRGTVQPSGIDALQAAGQTSRVPAPHAMTSALRSLQGHFAIVLQGKDWALAAVDRIRSTPLFYARDPDGWRISDRGGALARSLGLGPENIDPDAALSFAMAGYTIGADTLYRGLASLVAGEAVLFVGDAAHRIRYDRYRAWSTIDRPIEELRCDLAETTLDMLRDLRESAGARPIVIPLSAGLDSRLIASGLRHLGCRNVRCFSYGLPGNYEAQAAQRIADHLGYAWRFVPFSISAMRRFLASDDHAAYLDYADTCTNVPFEQDLYALRVLQREGYIPADAILVNGNSGDFISGGHIPSILRQAQMDISPAMRRTTVLNALLGKHFRLWSSLATPNNDARILARLEREIDDTDLRFDDPDTVHGVYEYIEMQDRQSKYVVSGQRVYEHAGLDWRLPLWDDAYLDFWQRAPLHAKAAQSLYRAMLQAENWGGVWQGRRWHFPRTVSPTWIRLPRLALKVLHAPLGRQRWHRFERRFLQYWMSNLASAAFIPYARIARDQRGARHDLAWLVEKFLAEHGLAYDGRHAAERSP